MRATAIPLLGLACLASPYLAQASCLSDAQAQAMAASYQARQPAENPPPQSEDDAACSRAKLNAELARLWGPVIGYKAGLTNPAVQKRFNYDKPVWGKLYQGMLLPNNATVDAAFGARPLFEADLLVRVKSEAINQAKTPLQVLEAIDQIIPFMELPDLVVQAPPKLGGTGISAINVGARHGVTGQPMAVPVTRGERYALFDALRDMTVVVTDSSGAQRGHGKGSDVLEHPLNAVLWLTEALQKEQIKLKPGDLLSLGSFSPLLPPKAGQSATVTYYGLPGAEPVTVHFK